MEFTVDQWREWFADATKTDPETIDQLRWLCQEMHEVNCSKGHKPRCADPLPADDDWCGWVNVLAAQRAAFWWMTVGAAIREAREMPDVKDRDTCTAQTVPPDTTSHMRKR